MEGVPIDKSWRVRHSLGTTRARAMIRYSLVGDGGVDLAFSSAEGLR